MQQSQQFAAEDTCQWYQGCTNEAGGEVKHHVRGYVRICDECADLLEIDPDPDISP